MKIKDQSYKKLEKVWYDKLKEGGFEDIEQTHFGYDGNGRLLKEWDSNFLRGEKFNFISFEAKRIYYIEAKQLLSSFRFRDDRHKRVWELHSEGFSEREIADQMKDYKKSMVHYIIARISLKIKGIRT